MGSTQRTIVVTIKARRGHLFLPKILILRGPSLSISVRKHLRIAMERKIVKLMRKAIRRRP